MRITRPTLLADCQIILDNIDRLSEKFRSQKIGFRPHFKTHQSAVVGEFFRNKCQGITVSSVEMAEYFAARNWNDITIAFPANPLEKSAIRELSEKVNLNLIVSDPATFHEFDDLKKPLNWWVKVDLGNHRAGIKPEKTEEIIQLAAQIVESKTHSFEGILGHTGQTYHLQSEQVVEEENRAIQVAESLRKKITDVLHTPCKVSMGDTPGCSLLENWQQIDEVRPGNFVFYDLMQMGIGSCHFSQIAMAMACPIVETKANENKAIIHGGAIHFSKEHHPEFKYGQLAVPNASGGWSGLMENSFLESISQEHGIISFDSKYSSLFSLGKLAYILPVHSCLTVDCMREYYLLPDLKRATTYRY